MKQTIYLMMAILLAASVLSLGIAPANLDIQHNADKWQDMFIVNNEHKDIDIVLYAQGENGDQLELSTAIIHLNPDDETVPFELRLAGHEITTPGRHEIQLVAMELPRETANTGTVIATRQAVISKINVVVPYPGTYAEGTLYIPKPSAGEPIDLVVKLTNLGQDIIKEANARIEIYSPTNELLANIQSNSKTLKPKEMRELVARYNNGLSKGRYYAKAIVNYDGKEFIIEDSFEIGNLLLELDNIYVKEFRLGEIAKFDIIVESKWNEPIPDVFADMEIRDKYGKVEAMYKTTEVDVPAYSKEFLEAFWDTREALPGRYTAKVTLHFLGNNVDKTLSLNVRDDAIDIDFMPTAHAIEYEPEDDSNMMIVVLVTVSIIMNIAIFTILARRKRE